MPLKFTHRKQEKVPTPTSAGKVNEDRTALRGEMQKLASRMVLEIEAGSEKAVRGTKMLITRCANQLGSEWQHWSVGTKVFAKPRGMIARRGRPKKTV